MVQLTGVDIIWALTSFVLFKISTTDLAPTCGEKQYLELATGVCMNCAVCSADLFLVHECDTISDSYCSPCPKGEVRDETTWNCEPCSCCTEYTTPQGACLMAGRPPAHSCLPRFGCTDLTTTDMNNSTYVINSDIAQDDNAELPTSGKQKHLLVFLGVFGVVIVVVVIGGIIYWRRWKKDHPHYSEEESTPQY